MKPATVFVLCLLAVPALAAAVDLGQIDDFQTGSREGWRSGGRNPNPPIAGMNMGPNGMGDFAMLMTANGGNFAGRALVVFNTAQWAGDYPAAGVTDIRVDLRNLSEVELHVRFVLTSTSGRAVATQAALLPAQSDYRTVTLSVRPGDVTVVGGADPAATVLADVRELRLIHALQPDQNGDAVSGMLLADNITAVKALECAPGLSLKADAPADLLLVPAYEVDTANATGLTTFFSVHNQLDAPIVAKVQYFDRTGHVQREDLLDLEPRRTRNVNVRTVAGLLVDEDQFARGWALISACIPADTQGTLEDLAASLSGDYIYLDNGGNFATGDQLPRREDICQTVQIRLLNFGSGIRLRLFATHPQGLQEPTATVTVYNEMGNLVETEVIVTEDTSLTLDASELVDTNFGTMIVEFAEGGGVVSVEYSAFGRFSVAMNSTCVVPVSP